LNSFVQLFGPVEKKTISKTVLGSVVNVQLKLISRTSFVNAKTLNIANTKINGITNQQCSAFYSVEFYRE